MKHIQLNSCSLFVADSILDKTRGVIGRESLLTNGLLLIPNCNWVHSFFIQNPLRIYFLSEDYLSLLDTIELNPNHFSRLHWNATHTLETSLDVSSAMYQETILYLQHNKI